MATFNSQNRVSRKPDGLLSQYPLISCRDIEQACEQIGRTFGPYDLQVLADRSRLITRYDGIFFKGIGLLTINYGAAMSVAQLDPKQSRFAYVAHTMLTGQSQLHFGREKVASAQGTTLVTSPNESYRFQLPEDSRRLTVMFEEAALRNHLSRLIDREVKQPIIFDVSMAPGSESSKVWLRTLNYLCTQLSQSDQLLSYPAFMRNSADMLMSLLLEMQPHNYSRFLQAEPVVNGSRTVRRAVEYIEAHSNRPVSLADVATAVGVSARVLQKGFRRYLDCTPCEYLRQTRLKRAHEALQNAAPDQKVAEVLYKNGVTSLGHFGQLYRRKYGCSPQETLKKTKGLK